MPSGRTNNGRAMPNGIARSNSPPREAATTSASPRRRNPTTASDPERSGILDTSTDIPYKIRVRNESEEIRFVWDPDKARKNLRQHKVSFEDATFVFDDPFLLEEDDVFSEGEYRMIVIGRVEQFVFTVVYSTPEEDLYRLISARLATAEERKTYDRENLHP